MEPEYYELQQGFTAPNGDETWTTYDTYLLRHEAIVEGEGHIRGKWRVVSVTIEWDSEDGES